jgi:6,7-dimethyl-8-ribityllumazine synthase
MPNIIEGRLQGSAQWRIAIIASRFNELITSKLLGGALDFLERNGVPSQNIDVIWVPGAFEIPSVAAQVCRAGKMQGIICLGAVIRGSTTHYEIVSGESAKGLANLGLHNNIPVINAIITTENIEQALERAGTKAGNKGFDAAMALIEMISLYEKINA